MQNDVYREKLLQFDWNVPSSIARSSSKFRWQTVLEYKNPAREISWGPNIKNITIFERRDNTRLCKKRRKAKERQPNMTGGEGGKNFDVFLEISFAGRRRYRVLQHDSRPAAPQAGHESGQGFSREMPISNEGQSGDERPNPRGHAAIPTAPGKRPLLSLSPLNPLFNKTYRPFNCRL